MNNQKIKEIEENLNLLENNEYSFQVREVLRNNIFNKINLLEDITLKAEYMSRYFMIK